MFHVFDRCSIHDRTDRGRLRCSPVTLQKWLQRVKAETGAAPDQTRSESAETRELRKRDRLLAQENEVLR